jgi:predicted DNA-binding protein
MTKLPMVKLGVVLDGEHHEKLSALSRELRVPVSVLLREAIDRVVDRSILPHQPTAKGEPDE